MNHFNVHLDYQGHDLRVQGDIQPAEKATWGYDGGSPPCDACIEDADIFVVRGKRERKVPDRDGELLQKIEGEIFEALEE